MNLYNNSSHIRTFTGKFVDVFDLSADDICIEDIAHALSNQCRWSGHCSAFMSVAQHSVNCAQAIGGGREIDALLHDGSEAYLVDVPRPIKHRLPEYLEIEAKVQAVIARKFGIAYPIPEEVKSVDNRFLELEWETLMLSDEGKTWCWTPEEAERQFLRAYVEYRRDPCEHGHGAGCILHKVPIQMI